MKSFHIIVWGATGFTGQLVVEYLLAHAPNDLQWAIAGRSAEKLQRVREHFTEEYPSAANIPIRTAESFDLAGLKTLASETEVICSTVGPYALYGSMLVQACVEEGADYCDLTGESLWIQQMIKAHHQQAVEQKRRIVHCCGFDSIPSDLGVWFLQQHSIKKLGRPQQQVMLGVKKLKGGVSGGTIASMIHAINTARNPERRRSLVNPYALYPASEPAGADKPPKFTIERHPKGWKAPFVMASINSQVVRRSNALLGFPYGRDFRYEEVSLFPAGLRGMTSGFLLSFGLTSITILLAMGWSRSLVQRFLPKPGQGPSKEQREAGKFSMHVYGGGLQIAVMGYRDPGYAETAKMLAESALALSLDKQRLPKNYGVLTPAAAMAEVLVGRLQKAGIDFKII